MDNQREKQDSSDLSDHDLLIRIDERVRQLNRCWTNHKRGHWAIAMVAISALVTATAKWIFSGGN